VVPMPHDLKGEGIYAYVMLVEETPWSEALRKELRDSVRKEIGPLATPEGIQFVNALPKTLSGKIMRRMLRKICAGSFDELGDTTSLAQPKVIDMIIEGFKNLKDGHPEQYCSSAEV